MEKGWERVRNDEDRKEYELGEDWKESKYRRIGKKSNWKRRGKDQLKKD